MEIKKFIGLHFPIGACNLRCNYCYVGQHGGKIQDLSYSLEDIKKAFSLQRLGGVCFINICGDGETLLHPIMPQLIEFFLKDGHYVMVLTNGTLTKQIETCLKLSPELLRRLFFKISFHFEEFVRLNLLDIEFSNIDRIKNSPCSLTVEYICNDLGKSHVQELKNICINKMNTLPQLNIPRDERKKILGVASKFSLPEFFRYWESWGFNSEFLKFRKQFFGKRYSDYCYTGERQIWVNLQTGYSHQCYHTPPLQNFMGECDKPIRWLAVGNNCPEAHCYVTHSHVSLGIVPYPQYAGYKATYDVIRNRVCSDGTEWIKPTYKEAFQQGVERKEHSPLKRKYVNKMNTLLRWYRREFPME